MTMFLQNLLIGLSVGSIYSLIGLGFVLIYKCSRVLNLAQGSILMLGAYILFALSVQLHLPLWLSFILTFILAALIGWSIERFALRPLIGQSLISMIMVTIALLYLLDGVTGFFWGGLSGTYPQFLPIEPVQMGNLRISEQYIWCFVISMLLFGLLWIYFSRTKGGLAMRVVAEDHQASQSSGIKVESIFALSWVIAAVVATVGGIFLGSIRTLDATLSMWGLKALPAVLLGGLDSIPGAVIGGLTIGILEILAVGYLDPYVGGGMREVAPFIIAIIILFIRPYGLFGMKRIERL